ncbi:hypothetical protein EV702DRAFT_585435 [Suillus placidus]|uniref:Uncharacterized protein n=1 Tax=Suillus placidus TaxID=48579 RepID=A0A9P6ZNN3_9AGAM|nr:hypothetical protein EV702DRAFT_585435 [Suillus placidus]
MSAKQLHNGLVGTLLYCADFTVSRGEWPQNRDRSCELRTRGQIETFGYDNQSASHVMSVTIKPLISQPLPVTVSTSLRTWNALNPVMKLLDKCFCTLPQGPLALACPESHLRLTPLYLRYCLRAWSLLEEQLTERLAAIRWDVLVMQSHGGLRR